MFIYTQCDKILIFFFLKKQFYPENDIDIIFKVLQPG